MRFRWNVVGSIFLGIGLVLLLIGGLVFARAREVTTWPRVPVRVDASRVVQPDAGMYSTEIVLSWTAGGRNHRRTLEGDFRTSDYEWAHSIVTEYAEGTVHSLPVNPDDPTDVRLQKGMGVGAWLAPAILGLLGTIFAGIGVVACLEGLRMPAVGPSGIFGTLFGGVAVVALLVAAVSAWTTLEILRNWPEVDAVVVDASPVAVGRRLTPRFVFRYTVDGKTYETLTGPGWSSTDLRVVEAEIDQYGAGTHTKIRVRPGDPNVVRYGMGYDLGTFLLPLAAGLFGLVFGVLGVVGSRLLRA